MSTTEEHSENQYEVAFLSKSPEKNDKPPRSKLRKTTACRPMHAALRINVKNDARSGFKLEGGFADKKTKIARMEQRAITLRNLGLAFGN